MGQAKNNVQPEIRDEVLRSLTVGKRTYRKLSRRDRRRKFVYSHPELRISNLWLGVAGFAPGDKVLVVIPRLGTIVIQRSEGS